MKKVIIFGAGGHAKVLADLLSLLPDYQLEGFLDDQLQPGTPIYKTLSVLGSSADAGKFASSECCFISGIGNNDVRKKLSLSYQSINWTTLIHPSAVIAPSAEIGSGSVVLAGAIVSSNSKIGKHCIVNSGVVVDHDCIVNDFVHLKTGSIIGSNSEIGISVSTEIGERLDAFTTLK